MLSLWFVVGPYRNPLGRFQKMNNTCEELIKQLKKLQHYDDNGEQRADGRFLLEDDVIFTIGEYRPRVGVG